MQNGNSKLTANQPVEKPTIINHQKGYVALPFEGDNLKDFITGLLGTPQAITKEIRGIFDINLSDLQDIDHLLNQRVVQQNAGKLLQLKIQIFFSDESSVSLNSLSELTTYNEVKPIVSKGVKMSWSYLIQFPDKSSPEKQEIEIQFETPKESTNEYLIYPFFSTKLGKFSIRIEHTARTWGTDIEYILTNKIETLKIKQSKSQLYIQNNASVISLLTSLALAVSCSYFVLEKTLKWNKEKTAVTEKFLKSTSSIEKKLDFAIDMVSKNRLFEINSVVFTHYLVYIMTAMILSIYLRVLLKKVRPSFITLTKDSVGYKDRMLVKYRNKTAKYWGSILLGFILNILSSLFFEKMLK